MRIALMTLSVAATMVAPFLSNTASATCWLQCRPPIIELPIDDGGSDDGAGALARGVFRRRGLERGAMARGPW